MNTNTATPSIPFRSLDLVFVLVARVRRRNFDAARNRIIHERMNNRASWKRNDLIPKYWSLRNLIAAALPVKLVHMCLLSLRYGKASMENIQ